MPWHMKTMKDVVSCDKFREGANNRLIRKFPNGATQQVEYLLSFLGGEPGELKHLSTRRKRKQ